MTTEFDPPISERAREIHIAATAFANAFPQLVWGYGQISADMHNGRIEPSQVLHWLDEQRQ